MAAKGKSNKLRIIGGTCRGRILGFPDVKGLRPTADRIRETLFNWLQADIAGARCLDLFAGSGALGLEALSRGAAQVTFCEHSKVAVKQLASNIELLNMADRTTIQQGNSLSLLQTPPQQPFDLVFVDPPFTDGLLQKSCDLLEAEGWLAAQSWIYLEQDSAHAWSDLPDNWQIYRATTAGQAASRLIKRDTI